MLQNIGLYLYLFQKFAVVLGTILYLIFGVIIVKQTSTMTKNINDKFNYILITFAYLHLAFSVFLVFLTLVML